MSEPEIASEYTALLAEIHDLKSEFIVLTVSLGALHLLYGDINLGTAEGLKSVTQAVQNFAAIVKVAREELTTAGERAEKEKTEESANSTRVM